MNISPFNAQFPRTELITSPDLYTESVKNEYKNYNKAGYYDKFETASLYICKIKSSVGEHIGLVASNNIEDLENGKILKHEHTLNQKEQTMISFLLQTRAMVKPVLLAHPPIDYLERMLEEHIKTNQPFLEFSFANGLETHSFWAISDQKQIDEIVTIFKNEVNKCYIADGHHRCSVTIRLQQSNFVQQANADLTGLLCIYFPFDQLNILDYNRSIDILHEIPPAVVMAKLSEHFKIKVIKSLRVPTKKHEIILSMEGVTYCLEWKGKVLNAHVHEKVVLDADLLNDYVFTKIMGVKDVRTDKRLSYFEGEKKLDFVSTYLKNNPTQICFFLYPVQIEELVTVANEGETLPPKSTWFVPRIKSGLIIKEF